MSPRLVAFLPFLAWRDRITAATLAADAQAGIVGALVVLPQGVAYATLAGLPPQHGLYCAMVPAIVAALWGSSWHLISGPTNALSLVVFATVAPLALPGSADYLTFVLTLCLLVGAIQLAMGLARLGTLVDFISHTVVVGFTAGAALLIVASQLHNFFGVAIPAGAGFFSSLHRLATSLAAVDPWTAATGAFTIVVALGSSRLAPRIPPMIVAMVAGSVFAWLLARAGLAQVPTVGSLGADLPPLSLPSFDPDVWRAPRARGVRPHRARAHRGGIDRARDRAVDRPAHRRQPGVHRAGTVEPRGRVLLRLPVVGLVQPQRRQLRGRGAHAARGGRLGVRARADRARRRAAGALPAARRDGGAAVRRRVRPRSTSREMRRIARTSRGEFDRARRHVRRRRSTIAARVRDPGRRRRVAAACTSTARRTRA